ncbi:hypothetical protein I545_0913 [Mycobacterium kansasii 662]|uniref:Uncharacterized protein n=3 Tax=Mycobacterium kansasii TaxID=1768 RepID=A0A1V3XX82_MYCKA|nr:hypothetical protein MKAN_23710 [Mycobacterium kansasii ATCC 12478]EUA03559.1 hypothetical protein I547_0372 [Mycobacterium kansasii 824]EUA21373.1 hypothetical protein I545_0913 [Mycobacterium kansasii 662]KEP43043.1 hypothetical protein MKSMC1_18350 [Mycobacterium kansasii]OOK82133.1 hypothetical protein BZL30_0774 [Mycobacterium kansasii]
MAAAGESQAGAKGFQRAAVAWSGSANLVTTYSWSRGTPESATARPVSRSLR